MEYLQTLDKAGKVWKRHSSLLWKVVTYGRKKYKTLALVPILQKWHNIRKLTAYWLTLHRYWVYHDEKSFGTLAPGYCYYYYYYCCHYYNCDCDYLLSLVRFRTHHLVSLAFSSKHCSRDQSSHQVDRLPSGLAAIFP